MIAGIKTGLINYKQILPTTKAKVCEVYFRIDKANQYGELFDMLRSRNIEAGLHFWGFLPNNIMYNLAYPDITIQNQSLDLIKQTIDIASQNNHRYVNIHPGYYHLVGIDLDKYIFIDLGKDANLNEARQILFENITLLHRYAMKRNVLFLTETMTCREAATWHNEKFRLSPINYNAVPVSTLIELSKKGFYITNDFGHTVSDEISQDRNYLFNKLLEKTQALSEMTKLIHPNPTKPPFTGIDTHNGVTNEDFSQNVLPDKNQIKQLLKVFKNRNDVWIIPEPLTKHEINFLAMQKIILDLDSNL